MNFCPTLPLPDIIAKLDEVERTGTPSDNLLDVFAPVRSLVEGDQALIRQDIYHQLRESDARVIASVKAIETKQISVVAARRPWVFFAIAGTEWGAPRWVYLNSPDATPVTDLEDVSEHLQSVLDEGGCQSPERFFEAVTQDRGIAITPKKTASFAGNANCFTLLSGRSCDL